MKTVANRKAHFPITKFGIVVAVLVCIMLPATASAVTHCGGPLPVNGKTATYKSVPTSIDIGCTGKGNAITDATFAIIRVLSDGVGLIIVGSLVVGGIQYSASRGDPQATASAVKRLRSTIIALLIFIFGYAFLNYIIPAGFLHQ